MKKLAFALFVLIVYNVQAQPRLWNMEQLKTGKSLTSEAAKVIVRDANKLLNKSIETVMDKEMTAASGDKHDYMSSGRYWWPDPTKADGLPYIRKDGVVNKEIDKLDRGPLSFLSKSVTNLALAFYLTSDDKYASKAAQNLRIWFINKETKMNPNMNFGQIIPGRNEGKGRGEGLIDTYSFVEMLDGIELLKKSDSFTKKDQQAINEWFTAYLNWMLTSKVAKEEREAKNNHGTAYDVQVVRYALFVGREDIAKKTIEEFAARRLFTQIEPDGAQPFELERTTALGYSTFNLTHILDMCFMAKTMNIDVYNSKSADGRNITTAFDFIAKYLGQPISSFPFKQIKEWDEVQVKLCWQLYRADKLIGKPLHKHLYDKYLNRTTKEINGLIY